MSESHVECICPVHANGREAIDHEAECDETCADTHAYWSSRLPLPEANR